MSVKTKFARQAVKTTAKHTAHGAAAKLTRRPLRSITLLTLGALVGGIVGWLVGRSGGGAGHPEPVAAPSGPTSVVTSPADQTNHNPTEQSSETGATT